MKLVDTNMLIYAVDPLAPHHSAARAWMEKSLSAGGRVLFPWIVLVAFVRITTGRAMMQDPLSAAEAAEFVEDWLIAPGSMVPVPDSNHLARWFHLLEVTGSGGNIVNDAHLAAIALQHDATVVSFDNDFSRFPGVRWEQPS